MSYSTAVELENVWKRFGAIEAVRVVPLYVPAGCVYGFLGPNGAGETTIIRMIMSVFFADEGRISVLDGQDVVTVKKMTGKPPRLWEIVGRLTLKEDVNPANRAGD